MSMVRYSIFLDEYGPDGNMVIKMQLCAPWGVLSEQFYRIGCKVKLFRYYIKV